MHEPADATGSTDRPLSTRSPGSRRRWPGKASIPRFVIAADRTEIVLRNCPFESAALADPDTVCSLHLGIAHGLAEGTPLVVEDLIRRDPRRANCLLRLSVAEDAELRRRVPVSRGAATSAQPRRSIDTTP